MFENGSFVFSSYCVHRHFIRFWTVQGIDCAVGIRFVVCSLEGESNQHIFL